MANISPWNLLTLLLVFVPFIVGFTFAAPKPDPNAPTANCPNGLSFALDCNRCTCNPKTGVTGCTYMYCFPAQSPELQSYVDQAKASAPASPPSASSRVARLASSSSTPRSSSSSGSGSSGGSSRTARLATMTLDPSGTSRTLSIDSPGVGLTPVGVKKTITGIPTPTTTTTTTTTPAPVLIFAADVNEDDFDDESS